MPDEKSDRMWAVLCHLSALFGFVFPFGHIIAPLAFWLMKKDEIPLVAENGKEALNFQLSMTIYAIVAAILVLVVIGIPLLFGLAAVDIFLVVTAATKTNDGEKYHYPLSLRFIK